MCNTLTPDSKKSYPSVANIYYLSVICNYNKITTMFAKLGMITTNILIINIIYLCHINFDINLLLYIIPGTESSGLNPYIFLLSQSNLF